MSPHPAPSEPDNLPDPAAARVEHYRDLLDGFLDLAVELRELVRLQVKAEVAALATETAPDAQPDDAPAPAPRAISALIASYDRLTRAVRRTILLCQALDAPPRPQAAPPDPVTARKRILREVQNRIASTASPGDAGTLGAELLERLEQPDLDDDILTRPLPEIVTEICRDLGLFNFAGSPAFLRRTPDDLRALRDEAAFAAARAAYSRPPPHESALSSPTPTVPRMPTPSAERRGNPR